MLSRGRCFSQVMDRNRKHLKSQIWAVVILFIFVLMFSPSLIMAAPVIVDESSQEDNIDQEEPRIPPCPPLEE